MLRHLVPLALAVVLGSASTCASETTSPPGPPPTATTGSEGQGASTSEGACVDAWLAKNKLDPYGNAPGTMYAGGTPLFDERTGQTTDRLEYVYKNHPDVKAACHP